MAQEIRREYTRISRFAFPERFKKYNLKYVASHKEEINFQRTCRQYGIGIQEYLDILESQGGVCAICGKRPSNRRLYIDHCHTSSEVRGLLCLKCNFGIGCLEEDVEIMQSCIEYIKKFDNLKKQ